MINEHRGFLKEEYWEQLSEKCRVFHAAAIKVANNINKSKDKKGVCYIYYNVKEMDFYLIDKIESTINVLNDKISEPIHPKEDFCIDYFIQDTNYRDSNKLEIYILYIVENIENELNYDEPSNFLNKNIDILDNAFICNYAYEHLEELTQNKDDNKYKTMHKKLVDICNEACSFERDLKKLMRIQEISFKIKES